MSVLVALTRDDVATYVDALFTVYFILIITRIILSWIQQFRPIPYNMTLRAVIGFVEDSVDPYLNIFRRWIPPLRLGGAGLDLSPIVAIIVLLIVQSLVVNAIAG
jgi:YggT family protein